MSDNDGERYNIKEKLSLKDEVRSLSLNQTLAQKINDSEAFHGFYGFLDGLSVSYSFLKFLCLSTASSTDDYHQRLRGLLTDPGFYLPIILLETLFITAFSYIANRSLKVDKAKANDIESFCRDYWPYLRDVLKGVKNGLKGIRAFSNILIALNVLNKNSFLSIILPVGLTVGTIGMLNRLYNRSINEKRANLLKTNIKLIDELKELNEFLQEKQDIERKINTLYLELKEATDCQPLFLRIQEQQRELNELKASFKHVNVDEVLSRYHESQDAMTKHAERIWLRMLISNGIGGFVDAPYLYAGVMTLAAFHGALLAAMTGILCFFFVACIVNRIHEESEKQRLFKQNSLQAQLSFKTNEIIKKQNEYYLLLRKLGKKEDATLEEVFERKFIKLFKERRAIFDEFQRTSLPSYRAAILGGMQDGLTAFGAVSCFCFGLGLALLLCGISFPPALIVANFVFGLVSMAAFAAYRCQETYREKQKHHSFFQEIKKRELKHYFPDGNFLSIVDCNTDLLTRGEFGAQAFFEVGRCLSTGHYKSMNLTTFAFSNYQERGPGQLSEPTPLIVFWIILGFIYSACLALRAYAKGFSKPPKDETSKPKVSPNRPNTDETPTTAPVNDSQTTKTPTKEIAIAKTKKQHANRFFRPSTPTGTYSTHFFKRQAPALKTVARTTDKLQLCPY